jgi:hypothetical protein
LTNKEKYIAYTSTNNVPLFAQPNWLDKACKAWDVFYIQIAKQEFYLAHQVEQKLIFSMVRPPICTPYSYLIGDLSRLNEAEQEQLKQALQNWFKKYTYVILDIANEHATLFNTAASNLKEMRTQILNLDAAQSYNANRMRELKKAHINLQLASSSDVDLLYQICSNSLLEKNIQNHIPYAQLKQLVHDSLENKNGNIFLAQLANETIGAAWVVYHQQTAYNLLCGSLKSKGNTGAMTLLQDAAIQWSKAQGATAYDFEGSMDDGVNNYYQSFGTQELKYMRVTKTSFIGKFLFKK